MSPLSAPLRQNLTPWEELYDLLASQVDPTRAEEGCINYDFHVDAKDPAVLFSMKIGEVRQIWMRIWKCHI